MLEGAKATGVDGGANGGEGSTDTQRVTAKQQKAGGTRAGRNMPN